MDNVRINIEGTTMTDSIVVGVNKGNVSYCRNSENMERNFLKYEELLSLLEDLEYAERKVGNEQELLEAIHSLENAIREGNDRNIVAVAKKFAKNFAGSVFTKAASGALVDAIKAWIAM